MKTESRHWLPMMVLSLLFSLLLSVTAFASDLAGGLDRADKNHIGGWAWKTGDFDTTVNVELHIYKDGSSKAAKVVTLPANNYDKKLSKAIGDGYHYFNYSIDLAKLGGTSYKVTAYAVLGKEKKNIGTKEYQPAVPVVEPAPGKAPAAKPTAPPPKAGQDQAKTAAGKAKVTDAVAVAPPDSSNPQAGKAMAPPDSSKPQAGKAKEAVAMAPPEASKPQAALGASDQAPASSGQSSEADQIKLKKAVDPGEASANSGPGVPATPPPPAAPVPTGPRQGKSLGMFTTTGYCAKCGGNTNLTYSGTIPKARHTLSADITLFPIGTKLMIDGIVYTVEDIGSSVKGRTLDIYYDTYEEALAHGKQTQEVFEVIE